jgi:hypothetical protein
MGGTEELPPGFVEAGLMHYQVIDRATRCHGPQHFQPCSQRLVFVTTIGIAVGAKILRRIS